MKWAVWVYRKANEMSMRHYVYIAVPFLVLSLVAYAIMLSLPIEAAIYVTAFLETVKVVLYSIFAMRLAAIARSTGLLAYRFFFIATLIWLPGQLFQAVIPIIDGTPYQYSSSADIFLFGAIICVIIGVIQLGLYGLQRREKIQILVHAVTLGSCVAFVATYWVSIVFLDRQAEKIQENIGNLVSLSLDLIILSVCIALALYRSRDKSIMAICIGLFFQVATDLLFLFSQFDGTTSTRPLQRALSACAIVVWFSVTLVKSPIPQYRGSVRSEVFLALGSYFSVALLIAYATISTPNIANTPSVVIYSFLFTFVAILVAQITGFFDNKRLVSDQQKSIVEISESEERYQELALHDTLTSLSNRTHFIEELENSLADSSSSRSGVAVFFIDLDRFKEINDTYGHSQGDEVIKTVAERIRNVSSEHAFICRLGGDEFALLVRGKVTREELLRLAHRILESIIVPIDLAGQETYLTCSIGIAVNTDEKVLPEALLRDADAAMYRAKEFGRNRVEFSDGYVAPVIHNVSWSLSDLRRAVAQNEITVFYQPIVDMATGVISSYEALARWKHPRKGFIPPDEFIPVAEDNGLIIEIGDIVLQEALHQLCIWDAESKSTHLRMNINLSLRQLNDDTFFPGLLRYCDEHDINASRINFEMTESSLLGDARTAMATLTEMQAHGFQLHIDDFGTGYSSLSYLKKFPIAGFKIDQSFIRGYGVEDDDTAIVKALVSLGKSLGLVVTAEGVQSMETRDALKEMGCEFAQGYLFSEPLDASRITIPKNLPDNVRTLRSANNA